eukprot:7122684-Karenia_brevis.AAC.1
MVKMLMMMMMMMTTPLVRETEPITWMLTKQCQINCIQACHDKGMLGPLKSPGPRVRALIET